MTYRIYLLLQYQALWWKTLDESPLVFFITSDKACNISCSCYKFYLSCIRLNCLCLNKCSSHSPHVRRGFIMQIVDHCTVLYTVHIVKYPHTISICCRCFSRIIIISHFNIFWSIQFSLMNVVFNAIFLTINTYLTSDVAIFVSQKMAKLFYESFLK